MGKVIKADLGIKIGSFIEGRIERGRSVEGNVTELGEDRGKKYASVVAENGMIYNIYYKDIWTVDDRRAANADGERDGLMKTKAREMTATKWLKNEKISELAGVLDRIAYKKDKIESHNNLIEGYGSW